MNIREDIREICSYKSIGGDMICAIDSEQLDSILLVVEKYIEEYKLNPDVTKRWVKGSLDYELEKEYDKALDDLLEGLKGTHESI